MLSSNSARIEGIDTPGFPPKTCWICGNPLKVDVDEHGPAVHEACYLMKVGLDNIVRLTTLSRKSRNLWGEKASDWNELDTTSCFARERNSLGRATARVQSEMRGSIVVHATDTFHLVPLSFGACRQEPRSP